MDARIRTKNQRTYPQRYKTVREPNRRDLHRVDRDQRKVDEVEEAPPEREAPEMPAPQEKPKERTKIQTINVEVPKDSLSTRRFKTAFMVIMMIAVLGICGVLIYSTFAKTVSDAPQSSAPSVPVAATPEIAVAATRIGSPPNDQGIKFAVAGGTTGYLMMVDPTTGVSKAAPIINGECTYEVAKGSPDMNVVVFDTQNKPHSWMLSVLLGGQP